MQAWKSIFIGILLLWQTKSLAQAILFDAFEPKDRPMAAGLFGMGIVLGPTLGPTLGGWIIEHNSWPLIFMINIPIGIIATFLSFTFIDKKEGEGKGFRMPYINGKFIFPTIISISIAIVRYNFPQYFSSLMDWTQWHTMFNVAHGLYWIMLVVLAIFSFLRSWSLIPLLGLSICAYLLTGMEANNWYWFFGWFGLGLIVYFSYGYRKSKLARA